MPDRARQCGECGSNPWQAEFDRQAVERLNAQIHMLKKHVLQLETEVLNHKLRELDQVNKESWNNRKVVRQRKQIRHLEDQLRKARVQPYQGLEAV